MIFMPGTRRNRFQARRTRSQMVYAVLTCRCLLGIVFAVSAFTKLRSPSAFRAFSSWVDALPVLPTLPAAGRKAAAVTMVTVEVAIVGGVALPWTSMAGLLLATPTLAIFAGGALLTRRRQPGIPCSCFGSSGKPLALRHVLRNAVLGVVAAAGAAAAARSGTDLVAGRSAGIALSLWGAVTAAMITVFLDDLATFRTGFLPDNGRRG